MVLLGGLGTGRRGVLEIPPGPVPAVWLSFDYPYHPPERIDPAAIPGELGRARRAGERAVAAAVLARKYLESRPDVDPARTVVAGGSLGAFVAVVAGAVDPGYEGVISLYGGGELRRIVARTLGTHPRWLRPGLAAALNPWLGPLDPVHYVSRISPRPFLMVNGSGDTMIPRESVLALHRAAAEPRSLVWIPTPHRVLGNRS